ncbi:MAG: PSP1 domain-containing protein [Bacteriovoracaceae bacterium]
MQTTKQFIKVRFPGITEAQTFLTENKQYKYGTPVVAMSPRGLAIGYINSFPYEEEASSSPLLSIVKEATEEDFIHYKNIYQEQRKIEEIAKYLIAQHELPMDLIHLELSSQGKKVTFFYTAPEKVDFRQLLTSLVSRLRLQIELRQVSKNKAKELSGVTGPCGPDLCLEINSFRPNASGRSCSEFHCCLNNNDPFYNDKLNRLPKKGSLILTKTNEMGRVESVNLVKDQFDLLTQSGMVKRFASIMYQKTLPRGTTFTYDSENITYSTFQVIGEEEAQKEKARINAIEEKKVNESSKKFAEETFNTLFPSES